MRISGAPARLSLSLLLFAAALVAQTALEPSGAINDFTGRLSAGTKGALERIAAEVKQRTGTEIAERLGLSVEPFETLLAVRDGSRRLSGPEIRSVFESYLNQITKAAEHVDRIDAAATENESARKES